MEPAEDAQDGHAQRQPMPPYITAPAPIPVNAVVRGQIRTGEVLGWRGDRVYLRYRTDAGNHLGWVPAADVERT